MTGYYLPGTGGLRKVSKEAFEAARAGRPCCSAAASVAAEATSHVPVDAAEPLLVSTLPELVEALRCAREARGWSQADVARALGIHKSVFAGAEQGRKPLSAMLMIAWARLVGMPLWAIPAVPATTVDQIGTAKENQSR